MCEEKNIGILVVHGIGDQKQFDCLKGVAQSIVDFLQSEINRGYCEVSVNINYATTGTFQSLHPAWQDGEKAPINVRIKFSGYEYIYNLHLREVWWADLDRPQNFGKFIKFWFWGLSLWAIPTQENYPTLNDPEGHLQDFIWEENKHNQKLRSRLWARFEYFFIGIFLLVCFPILFIIKQLLRLFDVNIPLTIIADYIGKLRLYQQAANSGRDLVEDFHNPPRFSVQRRMINALVRMAISNYDRWYVWSHSLGSMVAYNAFAMPEATLSHYISHSMWEEIKNNNNNLISDPDNSNPDNSNNRRPKPYKPVWQSQTEKISRKALFSKCEGLLTYGSPFWRIVDLWPDLVKRNQQHDFRYDFNWYNVIDPSDPVATRIKELFLDNSTTGVNKPENNQPKSLHPQDIFYRTPEKFLFAHTSYLSSDKKENNNSLIGQLLRWITEDKEIIEDNNLYSHFLQFPWQRNSNSDSSRSDTNQDSSRSDTNSDSSRSRLRIRYLRYHQIWRFIWWFVLILVAYALLYVILVTLLPISPPEFLMTWVDKIIGIFTQVISFLSNLVKPFLKNFLVFLPLVLVIIAGIYSSIRRKPIRDYILEYLQDNPNEYFTEKSLKNKFTAIPKRAITNALKKLVADRKILRKNENSNEYKYYYPFYQFQWIGLSEDSLESLKKLNLFDIMRHIINEFRLDPKKLIEDKILENRDNSEYYSLSIQEINGIIIGISVSYKIQIQDLTKTIIVNLSNL